jgi:hypothetical protein
MLAEWMNGILRKEFLMYLPRNLDKAREVVKESIRIYNEKRHRIRV